ncbi:outer membrane beta-barrel protein [Spirosoma sp. HMF4905]|uniref:Outer membrane beta-barrel protein n=1 Tax=Spirosoma arboris TaxID=2682092 RepID=A0A7K1SER5_9BACT|nr:porin family protein [Spirosoma arboris]MVM32300.1 outer membrane beta-barrel protein [Spirosoma arboris]
MKAKLIVLFLALTAFNLPGLAQTSFRIGLTAGANDDLIHFSWMPSINKSTTLWRYNAGVSFGHRLTPSLSVAYDLLYSRQGGVDIETSVLGYGSHQTIYKVDYLSLPIMVRYHPGGRRVFMAGGPQFGYLLAAKSVDPTFSETSVWDLQYCYRLDVGLMAGLGYRLGKHLVLSSRYYYGMKPIQKPDPSTGVYSDAAQKLYNRIWSSNLTYYF